MANAWWACYGSDYLSKTGHLTMLQHGAYFTLLNTYYVTGEPLPVNNEQLVRMCRAHSQEEIEAISFILSAFFILRTDGWHNKRADEELKEAKRISKLRRNARLGKRKSIDNQVSNISALQSQPQSHIETKSTPKAPSAFELPDWISKESWTNYEQMRDKIRKSMTNPARKFAVRTLERLRNEGNDPAAVLDQSTFNSWQGLFPIRSNGNGQSGRNHQEQPNAAVRRFYNNRTRIQEELGNVGAAAGADGVQHAPGLGTGADHLLGDGTKTILGR